MPAAGSAVCGIFGDKSGHLLRDDPYMKWKNVRIPMTNITMMIKGTPIVI